VLHQYRTTHQDKLGGFDIAVALLDPEAVMKVMHLADASLTAVTPETLPQGSRLTIVGYPGDKPRAFLWKCLLFVRSNLRHADIMQVREHWPLL
jgi:hypothetical protein